jgi:hypothetical protein
MNSATQLERRGGDSGVDSAISRALAKPYRQMTRRSFLSGVTRKLFAAAGVGLAAEVFPFFVQDAQASGPEYCGLHGVPCAEVGACNGGELGTSWVQCCPMPVSAPPCPTIYRCCTYVDRCSTTTQPPQSCHGSGTSWCRSPTDFYWCTEVLCTGEHNTLELCRSNCFPPGIGGFCTGISA